MGRPGMAGTPILTLVWGTEWWDDKLHARGSSKTWGSVPPSKRKKAPLVSGILSPTVARAGREVRAEEGGGTRKTEADQTHLWSSGTLWPCPVKSSRQEFFVGSS